MIEATTGLSPSRSAAGITKRLMLHKQASSFWKLMGLRNLSCAQLWTRAGCRHSSDGWKEEPIRSKAGNPIFLRKPPPVRRAFCWGTTRSEERRVGKEGKSREGR